MNADDLKALQAPIKERYRQSPETARIPVRARGTLGANVTCVLDTPRGTVVAGLHPAAGGSGLEACSGDLLMESLVACAGVTLNAVATALGIVFRSATIEARSEFDMRGTLGMAKDVPVGLGAIHLEFILDTDATDEQLATLLRLTERYCVIYQTLSQPPAMTVGRRGTAR
jgi:uncharacterized OsmC-like protein